MCESEFLVPHKRFFKILKDCAPHVPAGYFCRTPQSMRELCAIRQAKKQPKHKEADWWLVNIEYYFDKSNYNFKNIQPRRTSPIVF